MKKILMLDLEGVLIASGPMLIFQTGKDKGLRSHSRYFVREVQNIFDEIYMNTSVDEDQTMKIMQNIFKASKIEYWNSPGNKTKRYEEFIGDKLIHVEDGVNIFDEKKIKDLGFNYIPIKSFTQQHAWGKDSQMYKKYDKELLKVLEKIKLILK